ncbi:cytidine deaminase-like protein [Spinellus fusiger]|nr:cytidine deaminase-like protein [Spinellus fusiger]
MAATVFTTESFDLNYMHQAIEQANLSIPVPGAYCVGAILVKDGKVLSTGFSRELPGNTHAEECALMKVKDVEGSTLYTTMEPCSVRLSGNRSCTERVIESGIRRVVMGVREPPHLVICTGISKLLEHGIAVEVVPNVEKACLAPNAHIHS